MKVDKSGKSYCAKHDYHSEYFEGCPRCAKENERICTKCRVEYYTTSNEPCPDCKSESISILEYQQQQRQRQQRRQA